MNWFNTIFSIGFETLIETTHVRACTLKQTVSQYGINLVALALIESRSPLPICQRTSRNRIFGQVRFFVKDPALFTKPGLPLRDVALKVIHKGWETPQLLIPTHMCSLVALKHLIYYDGLVQI